MAILDVYSRQGCHLCEVLIEALLELVAGRAELRIHDIDADPDLRSRYDVRVPVVELRGTVLCEYQLDVDAVRHALAEKA